MVIHKDNPAGRLLSLALDSKKIAGHEQTHVAWCRLLGCNHEDSVELFRRLALVFRLVSDAECAVRTAELDESIHLKWKPSVHAALTQQLFNSPWQRVIEYYNDRTLDQLEATSDALHRLLPEPVIDESIIQKLLEEADRLIDSLNTAQLENRLREYLLRQVDLVRQALQDYRFQGPLSVNQAVQSVVGAVAINHKTYLESKETAEGNSAWDFLARVANIATIVGAGVNLVEKASNYVLPR